MSDENVCGIKDCDRPVIAMGMCVKHWRRTRKYGSPFATIRHAMQGLPVEVRFKKMHRKDGLQGCWLWTGAVDKDGYGVFHGVYDGVDYGRAHRYSWAFHSQSHIPSGMYVCHSCDTPGCVNPAHLWLGTVTDNHADMDEKGRRRVAFRGEQAPHTKLTEVQVTQILIDPRPYAAIAQDYDIAPTTVTSIKNRVSWNHVKVEKIVKNARGNAEGRGRKGVSDRITPEIVREIRASQSMGKDLAVKFGVSQQLIGAIKKRRCWAHVE
jgi:hypothetical protein